MEDEIKVLKVDLSQAKKLSVLSGILKALAFIVTIVSVVFLFKYFDFWNDYTYDEEDAFLIYFIISLGCTLALFISSAVLRGLKSMVETSEYQKAHIAQKYFKIEEVEKD